jgi:hypothetical protein
LVPRPNRSSQVVALDPVSVQHLGGVQAQVLRRAACCRMWRRILPWCERLLGPTSWTRLDKPARGSGVVVDVIEYEWVHVHSPPRC